MRERQLLASVEGGTLHQVEILNQPVCDECLKNMAERAAANDRIRRGPEK
ncbi:MAG: hypothetical protein J5I35_10930 [Methanothrix harundinacea]|nr:hypothetical protein [Methanothrix harundinacea]